MKKRTIVFAAAALGALAASAGVLTLTSPLGTAEATGSSAPRAPDVGALLDEMAPGAVVDKQADGSISIRGVATPAVQAEVRRARNLALAGPNTVRCSDGSVNLVCTAVPDAEVLAALRSGEQLHGRTVYRSVPSRASSPMFESGELVCGSVRGDGTMACSRVDAVQPVLPAGETLFVTYRPHHVTFDQQGAPVMRLGTPTVPLARASG